MFTTKSILTLFTLISLTSIVYAKTEKVDEMLEVQKQISKAYELGYVDAAPHEMSLVEKKAIEARTAKEKRKKKQFKKLIEQINADLAIIQKRHEVNELYEKLTEIQQNNMNLRKMLDELKGQL